MVVETTNPTEKRAGKCCGCCCDYRRAVIVCASVVMFIEFIVLCFAASQGYLAFVCGGYDYDYSYSYYYYIDTEECEEHFNGMRIIEIVFSVVSLLSGTGAIVGAVTFNSILVGINAAWICLGFIGSIIAAPLYCASWEAKDSDNECFINYSGIVSGIVTAIFFVYPHVMFVWEVKKGIMTKETYPRDKYSCCCTSEAATTSAVVTDQHPMAFATVAPDPGVSMVITESIFPDGSKQTRKEVTHPDGSKTITIITDQKESA
jgi:hypothetical protein